MSKKEKLISRLLQRPKDFSYSELKSLLTSFEYQEFNKGKTSGSRVAFINENTNHIIRLHKPHPKNILKAYQVDLVIEELKKENLL
ncbi:MAG: type II toxin-antitoxin system HicA family toxin [Chitinophagaceae bacterium]|nr:type II toxin-antitoxin system HicA family toxin [Chitinophagaceae bacterium]